MIRRRTNDAAPGAGAVWRERARREDGSVMVIAVVMLFIVASLATVAVAVAVSTNTATRRDSNYKNAAEAAEAGLQIALYRLNMLNPSSQNCVGNTAGTPGTNGLCQSSTSTLGNGSTYQYYTTPVLAGSSTCVGLTITSSDITQRCITAVGTSNGVTARSQIRAAAFTAAPLFPAAGAIGLNYVTESGNANVVGTDASNGPVSFSGNAKATGIVLGPGGSYTHSGGSSGGGVVRLTSPIVLSAVNPGTSNQSLIGSCPARSAAGYTTCNDDFRITNGQASPAVVPFDQSTGVNWNAANRTLTLNGYASLTLGGGLYNFCSISMSGNATITVAANVQSEIFIDSPDDPGSGCASGTGNLSMSGNAAWNNLSQNPLALQIYLYGLNNGSSSITLSGNANFYGTLYAPLSAVTLSGNGRVVGAVAGKSVTITGNGFNWDSRDSTLQATTEGLYYRTGWAQCSPSPPAGGTLQSGCG